MTIDLEKSLIRENKRLVMPKELLMINEYDKFTPLVENDSLSRVGLNRTLKEGRNIKNNINKQIEETKRFNQEKVFHISQIEAICNKYRLRFLPTRRYKGIIDNELPSRISTFEIAYNLRCNECNTMIVAPLESFELQEKPKDPLMFYQINNEYFYLIHKWGNDLSLSRAFLPFLENGLFSSLLFILLFTPFFLINNNAGSFAMLFSFIITLSYQIAFWIADGELISILKPNQWNSEYK